MRSSKSRSRSKSNRNRPSGGNIVNRVFDSSGPEGKVRGTPQQIIDKYNQLTRDAQLSGDRVAAENFAQHAEHYTRMLADAQREMDQRREQNDQQNRDRQQNSNNSTPDRDRQPDGEREAQQGGDQPEADPSRTDAPDQNGDQAQAEPKKRGRARKAAVPTSRDDEVIDPRTEGEGDESTLVETPEGKPKPRRRTRAKSAAQDEAGSEPETGSGSENQVAE